MCRKINFNSKFSVSLCVCILLAIIIQKWKLVESRKLVFLFTNKLLGFRLTSFKTYRLKMQKIKSNDNLINKIKMQKKSEKF